MSCIVMQSNLCGQLYFLRKLREPSSPPTILPTMEDAMNLLLGLCTGYNFYWIHKDLLSMVQFWTLHQSQTNLPRLLNQYLLQLHLLESWLPGHRYLAAFWQTSSIDIGSVVGHEVSMLTMHAQQNSFQVILVPFRSHSDACSFCPLGKMML